MRLTLGGSKRFSHYYAAVPSSIGDNNGDFEPLLRICDDNNRIYSDGVHEDSINRDEGMIKLLVRKLDGTSFDFFVSGDATVGEMKSELEKTVNELEMKALGYCDIQWEQVWTNFCLCYMNQKLLDDKASLKAFGIHNDDQVEFIHHKRFKSLKYLCWMVASKSCSWKAIHGDVETAVDVILDAAPRISDSIPESSESLSLEPSSDSNPCEITVAFEGLCYVNSVCIVSTSRICEVYCQRQPGGETDYICTARGEIDDSSVKPEGNPFYEAEVELVNADAWAALKIRLLSLISKSRLEIKKVTICAEVAETSPTSTSDNEKENTTDGTASMLTMLMPSMLQIVRGMSDGVENRRMQQNQPSSTLKEEESVTSKQLEMQKKSEEFQNEMRYRIQRLEMVVVRMETYLHTAFGKLDERVGKLEEQVQDGFSSLNKDRTAHEHIYTPSSPVEITPKGTAQVCSDDEDSSSIVSEVLMQETAVNSVVPQVSDQDAGGSLSITSVKENSNLVTQASQQLQQVPEETTRVLAPSEEPQLNQDDRGPSQSSSETSDPNNMDQVEVGAANETPPVQGLHDHVEVGAANETPPVQELAEGNQGESKDTIDSDTTENEQSLQEEGLTGIGAENLGAEAEGGKSNTDLIDFTATDEIVPHYVHVDEGEGGYVDDVFDLQPRPSEEDFHVATAIDTCTDLLSI